MAIKQMVGIKSNPQLISNNLNVYRLECALTFNFKSYYKPRLFLEALKEVPIGGIIQHNMYLCVEVYTAWRIYI